jgi:hypothetical protein
MSRYSELNRGPLPYHGSALPLSYSGLFPAGGLITESGRPGAGDGTRTRNIQLGRLILYQLSYTRKFGMLWGEQDSNLRSRKTTDLQSAPVGHFGISP